MHLPTAGPAVGRCILARYKVPKVVVFDDNVPGEDTGKLFKRKLRAWHWAER